MGKRLAKDLSGAVKEATRRGSEKRKYSSQRSQNRNSPAASSPSPARRNQQNEAYRPVRPYPETLYDQRERKLKNGSPRTVEENHLSKVQYSIFSPLCVYFYESSSAFLSALRLSARQFADPVRNLRVYALASDIHLSIAFLAAFFVLESLDGNTIKIILEDDRSCDCALDV